MFVDLFINKFKENINKEAFICGNKVYKYEHLLNRYNYWLDYIMNNLGENKVVAVQAEHTPDSLTFMLALIETKNIFVPFSFTNKGIDDKLEIAEAEIFFKFDGGKFEFKNTGVIAKHALIKELKKRNHPGVIIFSSGSTGKPKAAVHDFSNLLNKFKVKRDTLRTITFFPFDHWAGTNLLLYILSNAGVIGIPNKISPEVICKFIEEFKMELFPMTPTFMNLLLISKAYEKYDFSSIKVVTYGSEVMLEATLKAFHKLFPKIKLKQTYGMTEVGVMRAKSKSSDSLWVKIGGEDYKKKVVDGILYIKAKTTILGYLNAIAPVDKDGWYYTGDKVIQDGEWFQFLGRVTDIINVGGDKVYPAEVETVLLEMENIQEVSVFGKENPIMGTVVAARFNLKNEESISSLKKRVRQHCKDKLESFKIPVHIEITDKQQISDRHKKVR